MKILKIISITLVLGLAAAGGAYVVLGNTAHGQSDEPLLSSENSGGAVGIPTGDDTSTDETVRDTLRHISDLEQVKLNTDIFEKPEFLALTDLSQPLPPPVDVGRPNPFSPIGVDVGTIPTDEGTGGFTGGTTGTTGGTTTGGTTDGGSSGSSSVTTKDVLNIGNHGATLAGEIGITGATAKWFEWGTNQNTVNRTARQTGTAAVWTAALGNLSASTTYYVKAAAEVGGITLYGETISFTTAQ